MMARVVIDATVTTPRDWRARTRRVIVESVVERVLGKLDGILDMVPLRWGEDVTSHQCTSLIHIFRSRPPLSALLYPLGDTIDRQSY